MTQLDMKELYKKLPYETREQIDNAMTDDGLDFSGIGIDYLVTEVKWTIHRLTMEMGDMDEWYNPVEVDATLAACNTFLDQYSKGGEV